MPNICFNKFRIIGRAEEIAKISECKLDFQTLVPCAKSEQKETWGTCWEPHELKLSVTEEFEIRVECLTAWGPPLNFFRHLLKKFPSCWIKVVWEIELGWGSGIWIHHNSKQGSPIEKMFQWEEPMPYPDVQGNISIPD